jgi:hypothetical protein
MAERRAMAIEGLRYFQQNILIRLHWKNVDRIRLARVDLNRLVANRDALASI